jgi:hypothetical protein
MLTRKQLEDAAKCNSLICDKCSCGTDFGCEIEELAQTALKLADMLKRLEWVETPYVGTPCPVCGNLKRMGHTEDCELAAILAELEG